MFWESCSLRELLIGIFSKRFFSEKFRFLLKQLQNIMEIPNEIKGKYEYWACTFGVDNLQQTKNTILQNSGSVIIEEGNRILCADNSGQAFFYIEPNE